MITDSSKNFWDDKDGQHPPLRRDKIRFELPFPDAGPAKDSDTSCVTVVCASTGQFCGWVRWYDKHILENQLHAWEFFVEEVVKVWSFTWDYEQCFTATISFGLEDQESTATNSD